MSAGKSQSESQQQSTSAQNVAAFQVPFLQSLFAQAQGLAQQQLGPIQGVAQGLAGSLGGAGQQFLGGLQGIAGGLQGNVTDAISSLFGIGGTGAAQTLGGAGGGALPGQAQLADIAGGGGLAQLLGGPSPGLDPSIAALDAAIQQNLQSTLGTVGSQAALAGATGGSRQALAGGLAGQEAQRQFGAGSAALISQDFAQRQQLAPAAFGQQLAAAQALQAGGVSQGAQQLQGNAALLQGLLGGAQAGGQLGAGQVTQQLGAGQAGLGALSGLFNLGLAPFGAAFSPLQSLANILGPAIVLGESQSTGSSSSFAVQGSILS